MGLGLSDAVQAVKDAAGLGLGSNTTVGTLPALPWNVSNIDSTFFPSIKIDPQRWDELFPYRLLVVDSKNNKIVNGNSGSLSVPKITVTKGTGSTTVVFESNTAWIFTLPITPQQLNITDQYSINTTATLRGVLEEHNGVKFKTINAAGTLGVWPYRQSVTHPPVQNGGLLQSLFGSTINSLSSVVSQAVKTVNAFTGNSAANKPVSLRPETSDAGYGSTGYYLALSFQQFLEQYAEAKKDPANASWRLVFDIPKQKQSFVVTPMQFQWQQSANKTMAIDYNMQLKAWRRIDLDAPIQEVAANNSPITTGILQNILNGLSQARQLMSQSVNLIGSVTSDIEAPLNVLRQSALFVKDLSGVAITVADMPSQIITDYKNSIAASLAIISPNSLSGASATNPRLQTLLVNFQNSYKSRESLSFNAVNSGQLGQAAINAQSTDPSNNIFINPNSNFEIFNQVPLSTLVLTNTQKNQINQILAAAQATSVSNIKQYRKVILNLATQLSNSFGAGNAFYSKVYGKPTPTIRIQPMSVDEFEIIASLYQVIQNYDILTATTQIDDANSQTNMDYVAGLAAQSGIIFNTSTSKILAPVPFGLTIEAIASRYLGDPQRWIEIVTLNNLMDPYIDENGFQYTLLSNATGRQIVVDSDLNLYLGQNILLQSSTQVPTARSILAIEMLSSTSFLITLDGQPNLNTFTLSDGAYLQAYLPQTVNSQQKIFIPSDLATSTAPNIIPPASTSSDPYTGLSKVDWLLTDNGDIALNSFGDFRYSSGLTNIIQALKIKFSTILGTVLLHPNFGVGIRPGTIASDIQLQDLYNSINQQIQQDPRFQGVTNLQISLNGPTLSIGLMVDLAGTQGVFPINFNLAISNST